MFYTTGFFTNRNSRAILAAEIRALPGKDKDMFAICLTLSKKEYSEYQSSYDYLDGLFVRSDRAEKRGYVIQ